MSFTVFCFLLPIRNVLLCDGVHGHHDHRHHEDHHPAHHGDHDHHHCQDHHDQGAGHDGRGGPVAADHVDGAGPGPDAGGGLDPRGGRQSPAFFQAPQRQGGVLQPPGDDGHLLAEDQAGRRRQDVLSYWIHW